MEPPKLHARNKADKGRGDVRSELGEVVVRILYALFALLSFRVEGCFPILLRVLQIGVLLIFQRKYKAAFHTFLHLLLAKTAKRSRLLQQLSATWLLPFPSWGIVVAGSFKMFNT